MNPDLSEYIEILGFSEKPWGATQYAAQPAPALARTSTPAPEAADPMPALAPSGIRVVFVAEAADQAETQAFTLLSKMITAMNLNAQNSKILVENPDWASVEREVLKLRPEIIVTLGTSATHALLKNESPLGGLRGEFHTRSDWTGPETTGIQFLPTYAPSFLLRNPAMKKPVWEDLQKVMERLGLK
jgi:hypothetical protein